MAALQLSVKTPQFPAVQFAKLKPSDSILAIFIYSSHSMRFRRCEPIIRTKVSKESNRIYTALHEQFCVLVEYRLYTV